jgi:hypothetical protein
VATRAGTLTRVNRGRAIAALALLLAIAPQASCARPDASACRVEGERVLGQVASADPRGAFVPADGEGRVALFFLREPSDAGNPLSLPSGVAAIEIDAVGAAKPSRSYKTHSRLAARAGSTEMVGAVWTPRGVVWHWVERVSTTEADGTLRSEARLVLGRVDESGEEDAAVEPEAARCADCRIAVDGVAYDGAAVLVFAAAPEAKTNGGAGANVAVLGATALLAQGVVRVSAQAVEITSPLPGAALPVDTSARLDVVGGRLWLLSRGWQQPVDAAMRPAGFPVPRPNPVDSLLIPGGAETAVVWTALTGDTGDPTKGGGTLTLRTFGAEGANGPALQVSSSARAVAAARSGDRFAVLHTAGAVTWLSVVSASGSKLGADVPVGSATESAPGRALLARDRTRWLDLEAANGKLVAREIVCEP